MCLSSLHHRRTSRHSALSQIIVNEYFVVRHSHTEPGGYHFKWHLWQIYLNVIPLGFAALSSQLVTDVAKYSTGRLRPHFIDLCRPEVANNGQVITRFSICQNPYEYVTEYKCTNFLVGDKLQRDARLSFMSGHSSFVAVCMVYLIVSQHSLSEVHWHQSFPLNLSLSLSLSNPVLHSTAHEMVHTGPVQAPLPGPAGVSRTHHCTVTNCRLQTPLERCAGWFDAGHNCGHSRSALRVRHVHTAKLQ